MADIYVYDGSGRPDRVSSEEALDNPDKEVYSLPNGRPERIKVSEIENSDGFVYFYENGRPVRFRGRESEFSPLRLVIDTNLITGTTFELPITGGSGSMRVDWGDGTEENFETLEDVSHEYASDGEYEINVYSTNKDSEILIFEFKTSMTEVRNWGSFRYNPIENNSTIFDSENINNIIYLESPDSNLTKLSGILGSVLITNIITITPELDITNWDVSNVTDMFFMFSNNSNFNQDISNWDVSKVINMRGMFADTESFDQNLGPWQLNPDVILDSFFDRFRATSTLAISPENYARTLIGWANNIYERGGVVVNKTLNGPFADITYSTDTFNDISGQFNNVVDARDYLINELGWEIQGDSAA